MRYKVQVDKDLRESVPFQLSKCFLFLNPRKDVSIIDVVMVGSGSSWFYRIVAISMQPGLLSFFDKVCLWLQTIAVPLYRDGK